MSNQKTWTAAALGFAAGLAIGIAVCLVAGQAELLRSALLGVFIALVGGVVGAFAQAHFTRQQTFELHRTERRQQALVELLDHLSMIQLEIEKSLSDKGVWVRAAPGLEQNMVRELLQAGTWELSGTPDEELGQWAGIVQAIHETEGDWRHRLAARVDNEAIEGRWREISRMGFALARIDTSGPRTTAFHLRKAVPELMALIRKMA